MCKKESKEYRALLRRISQLEKHFSFTQAINGITPLQSDRLRGLRVLCHAEFEDYFESIALLLVSIAEAKWDRDRRANYTLASLFICSEKITASSTNITKSKQIIAAYRKKVKDNHGFKEHNLRALFEPLGYSLDDFDSSFIATLSSFGSLRGETAHLSAKKTQQPLDQSTEIKRIDEIKTGILNFETVLFSKL